MQDEISVGAARIDLGWLQELIAQNDVKPNINDLKTALLALESLNAALGRIEKLETSRIGADDFLSRNGLDTYSFYQGVSFALAKVHQAILGWS